MTSKKTSFKSKTKLINERRSGILLHLSSLPGPFACGDLGSSTEHVLDFLKESGQTWWQTLPINPIGTGNSPYSSISSFAGEVIYVSADGLYESGLLKKSEVPASINSKAQSHYVIARDQKLKLLKKAFRRKQEKGRYKHAREFRKFRFAEQHWLSDFALYKVLSNKYGPNWAKWPKDLRNRNSEVLGQVQVKYSDQIEFIEFCQFEFFRQWFDFKKKAAVRGVHLMGDIPIFVSHQSADVWANQDQFFLNRDGGPSYVAGCPPDKFCPDGQLWGNALYNWKAMEKDRFKWWLSRFDLLFRMYDAVRLDHFIGFYNYWKIPASAKTAKTGKWERAKGEELFRAMRRRYGAAPLLAEDLGKIKQGVWDLRDKFGFPGMKIIQFGFAVGESMAVHKLHQIPENSITYSGTHDNDTGVGWYKSVLSEKPSKHERSAVEAVFSNPKKVGEELIKLGMYSRSNTFIFPVQDLLNQGSEHRMNIPGTPTGNWEYRLTRKSLDSLVKRSDWLAGLSRSSERN